MANQNSIKVQKNNWHIHEKKIKDQLKDFFTKKGYVVTFHRYYNSFDVICAKINNNTIDEIIGIEIKSDKDNLNRLKNQLLQYIRIFDKVYVALENKETPEFIPPFIGVIKCNNTVKIIREAEKLNLPAFGPLINYSAIEDTIKGNYGLS